MFAIIRCRIFCLPVCYPKIINVKIYRILILPVVYGCETWSLTLREERRLNMFENRTLRRIFGPKRDEVTGEWRKLRNGELYHLYPSPNIIRVIKPITRKLGWACSTYWGEERCMQRFGGRYEGKRPFGRSSRG